jgi:hypothetical protein
MVPAALSAAADQAADDWVCLECEEVGDRDEV